MALLPCRRCHSHWRSRTDRTEAWSHSSGLCSRESMALHEAGNPSCRPTRTALPLEGTVTRCVVLVV